MVTVVGVDIGGTKTRIVASGEGGVVADRTVPTDRWRVRRPDDAGALVSLVRTAARGEEPAVIVVGAHGCDSAGECADFQNRLAALADGAVLVVNDAELLVPAAGLAQGIGVVAGTGSIAVTRLPDRTMLVAGGWGWLLGDEGGAVGLVREAARAVRASLDSGRPPDQLARALMRAIGADEPVELGRKLVQAGSNAAIGRHAAAVFAAAEEDSSLARAVIRDGGRALALLVQRLVGRGAAGGQVVAGGGVITRQPALMAAFQEAMAENLPAWQVRLLTVAPVMGAVALAERILAGEECVGMAPTPAVART